MNLPPIRASHDNISSPVASTNVTSDKFTTSRGGIFVCVTRSLVSLANGPTNRPCSRMVKVSPTSSNSTRSIGGLQSTRNIFQSLSGSLLTPRRMKVVQLACHRKAGVSCCSRRSLDVTRVFAMPCSGQCLNVGSEEGSQRINAACSAHENAPSDQPAHLNEKFGAGRKLKRNAIPNA